MAVNILGLSKPNESKIQTDSTLRASLQLPERSGTARGMIYTPRTNNGHADAPQKVAAISARHYFPLFDMGKLAKSKTVCPAAFVRVVSAPC
jgi:hypothetical protein